MGKELSRYLVNGRNYATLNEAVEYAKKVGCDTVVKKTYSTDGDDLTQYKDTVVWSKSNSESKMVKESLNNDRTLNEGAGAGYDIKGDLSDVKITKINKIEVKEEPFLSGTLDYAYLEVEGTANFEGYAESYYYGIKICETPVAITQVNVNPNILDNNEIDDYNELTPEMLNDAFYIGGEFESDTIGGGWSHSTFDSYAEGSFSNSSYEVDEVGFSFTDEDVVKNIDTGVSGETYTEYCVYDEDGDMLESFEDEDEAIDYAKKNRGVEVVEQTMYLADTEGNWEYYDENRTVWERESTKSYKYDESKKIKENKKSLKENIFIRGEGDIEVGDFVIFNSLDNDLNDWVEEHPSDHGYEIVEVDKEKDGTPTGMYWIKDCPYALDYNEDGVEKIDFDESLKDTTNKKPLKEEYGPCRGEQYCDDIADELENESSYGYVYVGDESVEWEIDINGYKDEDFQCDGFFTYLLRDIAYPVRDGFLYYGDLDEVIYGEHYRDEWDKKEFKHDLEMLGVYDKESFKRFYTEDGYEMEFWIDYDTNFDVDKYEELLDSVYSDEDEEEPVDWDTILEIAKEYGCEPTDIDGMTIREIEDYLDEEEGALDRFVIDVDESLKSKSINKRNSRKSMNESMCKTSNKKTLRESANNTYEVQISKEGFGKDNTNKENCKKPLIKEDMVDEYGNDIESAQKYWNNEIEYNLNEMIENGDLDDELEDGYTMYDFVQDTDNWKAGAGEYNIVDSVTDQILSDDWLWEQINGKIEEYIKETIRTTYEMSKDDMDEDLDKSKIKDIRKKTIKDNGGNFDPKTGDPVVVKNRFLVGVKDSGKDWKKDIVDVDETEFEDAVNKAHNSITDPNREVLGTWNDVNHTQGSSVDASRKFKKRRDANKFAKQGGQKAMGKMDSEGNYKQINLKYKKKDLKKLDSKRGDNK